MRRTLTGELYLWLVEVMLKLVANKLISTDLPTIGSVGRDAPKFMLCPTE